MTDVAIVKYLTCSKNCHLNTLCRFSKPHTTTLTNAKPLTMYNDKQRRSSKNKKETYEESLSSRLSGISIIDDHEAYFEPEYKVPLNLPAEMRSHDYAEVGVMARTVQGVCLELVRQFMPRDGRLANFNMQGAGPSSDVATTAIKSFALKAGIVVDSVQYEPRSSVSPHSTRKHYGLATCFFGMPSVFVDEPAVREFLLTVSNNLAPGGVFVGACPDAKEIMKLITEDAVAFASHRVHVERLWTAGKASAYGSMYEHEVRYKLGWSDSKRRHREYLVFESVLKRVAETCGLLPVKWAHGDRLSRLLRHPHTSHHVFRLFHPDAKVFGEGKLDLLDVCATYAAFAFVKIHKE